LGLTGLSCQLYAILAVTQNTPQPIWWFVPTAMGVFAGISTFVAAQYQTLMSSVTGKGRYLVVLCIWHLAIVDADKTLAAIKEDLSGI